MLTNILAILVTAGLLAIAVAICRRLGVDMTDAKVAALGSAIHEFVRAAEQKLKGKTGSDKLALVKTWIAAAFGQLRPELAAKVEPLIEAAVYEMNRETVK